MSKNCHSYCNGIFCLKADRKHKCCICNIYICGKCQKEYKNKIYCPDCLPIDSVNNFLRSLNIFED